MWLFVLCGPTDGCVGSAPLQRHCSATAAPLQRHCSAICLWFDGFDIRCSFTLDEHAHCKTKLFQFKYESSNVFGTEESKLSELDLRDRVKDIVTDSVVLENTRQFRYTLLVKQPT